MRRGIPLFFGLIVGLAGREAAAQSMSIELALDRGCKTDDEPIGLWAQGGGLVLTGRSTGYTCNDGLFLTFVDAAGKARSGRTLGWLSAALAPAADGRLVTLEARSSSFGVPVMVVLGARGERVLERKLEGVQGGLVGAAPAADGHRVITASLSAAGEEAWHVYRVGEAAPVSIAERPGAQAFAFAADGGVLLARDTARERWAADRSPSPSDVVVERLSPDGQPAWQATAAKGPADERVQRLLALDDGGALVAGKRTPLEGRGFGKAVVFVARLDGHGAARWLTEVTEATDAEVSALAAAPDGGALVATTSAVAQLARLGGDGKVAWARKVVEGQIAAIAPAASGATIAASVERAGQKNNIRLFSVDEAGNAPPPPEKATPLALTRTEPKAGKSGASKKKPRPGKGK